MKIADNDFNRELSKYISTRRNIGKPFHVQIIDYVKETKRSLSNVSKIKREENLEENEAVEIEVERPEELMEEYEYFDKMEEEIKKEKKSFWSFFTDAFRKKIDETEDMDPEEIAKVMEEVKEETEEFEDEYQELKDMEEEIEEKKEGIFKKIGRFFSAGKNEPEIIEEVAEEFTLNEDVREAFKVLTKWLEKLPEKELSKFKESEDFEKYKAVLRRYNMIK